VTDELVVITPSRGRPRQLVEMIQAVTETTYGHVRVLPCLDDDDPELAEYRRILPLSPRLVGPRKTLVGWTNHAARVLLDQRDPPRYLASLGDDHRPRTAHWDQILISLLDGRPGIAYGDDLYQHERVPTAWVVSTEIVRAVGWMMLPSCEHLYVDNAVRDLGLTAGCLVYRPDVVIEHMHPVAGKGEWDASYRDSNGSRLKARDRDAYRRWVRSGLDDDAAKIRAIREGAGQRV